MDRLRQIEGLRNALDAENIIAECFRYLSALIKNGRIRNIFISFSDSARNNQLLLKDRLSELDVNDFVPQDKCTFCRINTESFSLSGAFNLGLEANAAAIKFYKGLSAVSKNEEDNKLFKSLIKEKNRHQVFLKKEKKFLRKEEDRLSMIDTHCITEVISQLWK